MPPAAQERGGGALALAGALVLLCGHAAMVGAWLVDDAGISFAYARNLTAGAGLVSQPGLEPVEAFSNPLWTLGIAVVYLTRLFVVPWTPKLLALAITAMVFVRLWRDLRARGASPAVQALVLCLLASCTPFVVWSVSGLENPLLALLVVIACGHERRWGLQAAPGWRADVRAGLLAGLLALVRPEAATYALVPPLVAAWTIWRSAHRGAGPWLRRVVTFGAACAIIVGPYLLFRLIYFDDWVPNTFHAKPAPSVTTLFGVGKLLSLLHGAAGDAATLVALTIVGLLVWRAVRGSLAPATVPLAAYLALSIALYLLLPVDWMGEFRFATPVVVLLYWLCGDLAMARDGDAPDRPRGRPAWRLAAAAAVSLVAIDACLVFAARSRVFAACPPVPLASVQTLAGEGFNQLAARLPGREASLLTPDVGGVLLSSSLRLYDLAGLSDKTIARSMGRGEAMPAMRDYVLDTARPTFIHMGGAFVRRPGLYEDQRFARDYVAIHESHDVPPGWASTSLRSPGGRLPWWGDYVRRDALDVSSLAGLRAEHARLGLSRYRVWREPGGPGWPALPWALRVLGASAPIPAQTFVSACAVP